MLCTTFFFLKHQTNILFIFASRKTFLLEGELPVLDFLGIVFGHVYHHCKTVGLLRAPDDLVKWYKESDSAEAIRKKYKKISVDFEMI